MPISYKNKIYTTLGTPTAVSGEVVSVTNSAGVPVKDYTIKGKTIVDNDALKSISPDNIETKNQSGKTRSVNIPSSKYFPDGMKSAGSAYDEINFLSQKAIKRIGAVDMGTLNWTYVGAEQHQRFTADLDGIKITSESTKGNLVCSKYTTVSVNDVYLHAADKTIAVHYINEQVWVYDTSYTDAAAFKAAMSGVMLYYELATPVETAIAPPLQALSTFNGFTSFSAPNSLTQNGPLSVTYYAEGGANPEKGWLTSYKRKLYMGRSIEWNQLLDKSKYPATTTKNGVTFTNNGDGSITVDGTAGSTANGSIIIAENLSVIQGHKYYATMSKPIEHNNFWLGLWASPGPQPFERALVVLDPNGQILTCVTSSDKLHVDITLYKTTSVNNATVKPQFFDLTEMFGAGNEPVTPAEFWSYFDHKLYPYNPGETQPLFKISRKSQWENATPASLYVGENIIIPQIVRN